MLQAIEHGDCGKVEQWYNQHIQRNPRFNLNVIVDTRDGEEVVVRSEVSRNQMTALNYAAFFGRLDIVEFLLDNGASELIKKHGTFYFCFHNNILMGPLYFCSWQISTHMNSKKP